MFVRPMSTASGLAKLGDDRRIVRRPEVLEHPRRTSRRSARARRECLSRRPADPRADQPAASSRAAHRLPRLAASADRASTRRNAPPCRRPLRSDPDAACVSSTDETSPDSRLRRCSLAVCSKIDMTMPVGCDRLGQCSVLHAAARSCKDSRTPNRARNSATRYSPSTAGTR